MYVNATYEGKVELDQKSLTYLQQFKVIALYSAVQFTNHLPLIQKQLEAQGHIIIGSVPERTNSIHQILGCDLSLENLKLSQTPDAFLYIGDGLFHPQALVYAQMHEKQFIPVIRYDPKQHTYFVMSIDEVKKNLQRYKGNLLKFLTSTRIGVLISTKPGQQMYKPAKLLEEKFRDKQFYYFVENTIDYASLENFPFIEMFVNSACPRMGIDDHIHVPFALLNLNEALNAKDILAKYSIFTSI